MKMTFSELLRRGEPATFTIHSLDQALYQVTVTVGGAEYLLREDDGRPFRRHSLTEVRESLQVLPVTAIYLRQTSAYDEMIGQPVRDGDNTLELPLSLTLYPPSTRH